MACFSFTLALACETRRKKAIGRHLDKLNKETDHHLYLVPTCRAEETSREECCLQTQSMQQNESELKPKAREASTTYGLISRQRAKPRRTRTSNHRHQSSLLFLAKKFPSPVRDQSCGKSTRSSIHNQSCVLKLYSVWFLLCHTCHVYSLFICLLVFV
ncbi:hypothetical protein ACFX10_034105 [Malus domestica]